MSVPDLGLGPAAELLAGAAPGARATHALYPPRGTPRLLVPLRPRRAAAASVQHYTTPSSVRDRGLLRLGAALARLGAADLAPRMIALHGLGALADHLSGVIGEELAVGVHLGPPRANRKPVLQLMDHAGRPVAYAKLGINDLTCGRVRAEAAALHQIARSAPTGLVAPAIVADGVWEGLDYLVMRPVPTWSVTPPSREARAHALDGLTAAFASTRTTLADASWWRRTTAALDACDGPDAARLRTAATQLVERYGHELIESGAGHGDWTPWNMCTRLGTLAVWDWERFGLDVPRGWDELHFTIASHPGGAATALAAPRAVLRSALTTHQRPGEAVLAAYLLNRAVGFIVDRQLEAGAPNGPLRTWLLPALDDLVEGPRPT